MNENTRSQLTAWFDNELEPDERQQVASLIERDPEARAFVEELRKTREALKTAHTNPVQPAPDWRHFNARLDSTEARPARTLTFSRMILATAAIMVLGMAVWWPLRQASIRQSVESDQLFVERVEFVETDLEGATPIVYLDQPSGWTVVWVVEPAETES